MVYTITTNIKIITNKAHKLLLLLRYLGARAVVCMEIDDHLRQSNYGIKNFFSANTGKGNFIQKSSKNSY